MNGEISRDLQKSYLQAIQKILLVKSYIKDKQICQVLAMLTNQLFSAYQLFSIFYLKNLSKIYFKAFISNG